MAVARQPVEKHDYTEDEYFALDSATSERWEFVRGRIRAMSGGTVTHSAIAANIIRSLGNALTPKGCRVFGSDLKVHTGDDVNTYPDISVVCGEPVLYRGRKDIVTNPILVVEVLSESTAHYDRTEKFDHYQTIPTLCDYLLVEQDEPRALLFSREGDQWQYRMISGREQSITLSSVGVTIALSDIYTLVAFSE